MPVGNEENLLNPPIRNIAFSRKTRRRIQQRQLLLQFPLQPLALLLLLLLQLLTFPLLM